MNQETKELIKYRISRAEESLDEAILLFNAEHYNTSVNRLYYACFYAVSALLLLENMSSPKHSGVRSLFNQHWVKKDRVSKELGKFFSELFDYRQRGDYTDYACFEREQVVSLINESKVFVQIIKSKLPLSVS